MSRRAKVYASGVGRFARCRKRQLKDRGPRTPKKALTPKGRARAMKALNREVQVLLRRIRAEIEAQARKATRTAKRGSAR